MSKQSNPLSRGNGPIALLRPIKRVAVNEQILSRMKAFLEHQDVKIGSRLPSERQLTAMLGVSRPSIREVLRSLSALGIVTPMQGRGTYLTASLPDAPRDGERVFKIRGDLHLLELWETRMAFEPFLAWLAAARCSPEDLQEMEEQNERMSVAMAQCKEDYLQCDLQFHLFIANACGNGMLTGIASTVLKAFFTKTMEQFRGISRNMKFRETDCSLTLTEHKKILSALSRHDQNSARSTMTQHFERDRRIGEDYDVQILPALGGRRSGKRVVSSVSAIGRALSAERLVKIVS
jgi:GntR family transcriptional regulator, transcriptional repressor for pyruvate dehydrogenase complex